MKKKFISGLLSVLYAALMILSPLSQTAWPRRWSPIDLGMPVCWSGWWCCFAWLGGMRVAFIGKRQRRR
jgi:hypothetical protein